LSVSLRHAGPVCPEFSHVAEITYGPTRTNVKS
jgi:hypothetical protein